MLQGPVDPIQGNFPILAPKLLPDPGKAPDLFDVEDIFRAGLLHQDLECEIPDGLAEVGAEIDVEPDIVHAGSEPVQRQIEGVDARHGAME